MEVKPLHHPQAKNIQCHIRVIEAQKQEEAKKKQTEAKAAAAKKKRRAKPSDKTNDMKQEKEPVVGTSWDPHRGHGH